MIKKILFLVFISSFAFAGPIFDNITVEDFISNPVLGTNTNPTIRFVDNDSGIYQTGDGNISFSANGFHRLSIDQNDSTFTGPLNVTGNISAANYPPTGSANSFSGFDGSGNLFSIPGWSLDSTTHGLQAYTRDDISGSRNLHSIEAAWEIPATVSADINTLNIDSHFDRDNTGESITGRWSGLNLSQRLEGSGKVPFLQGAAIQTNIGENGGQADNIEGLGVSIDLADTGGATTGNVRGINLDIDAGPGTITNDLTMMNLSSRKDINGNFNAIQTNNSNDGIVSGDFRFLNLGNGAEVEGNTAGALMFFNGKMDKAFTGLGIFGNNTEIGDGSSYLVGVDVNLQNTILHGGMNGFAFSMNDASSITGTNSTVNAFNGNIPTGVTGYRATGLSWFDGSDMTEEKRGIQLTMQGSSRTASGLDINMQGEVTDDARGLRIDVNNLSTSSTTQHINAMEVSGGTIAMRGKFKPFDNMGVEIGNGFFFDSTIDHDLVGTDQLIQFHQSNLILDHDIAMGPFGLGTVMSGFVSQIAGAGGKHVDNLRTMLVGTTVPQGTGHLVDKHQVITMLGLPSFGGSVVNPYRVGIEDAPGLVGQNFCDGASECWTFKSNDPNGDVYFAKNVIIGGSTQHDVSNAGVVVTDKHIRVLQTNPPAASVDTDDGSNAGTDATCTLDSGDTDHNMHMTLETGVGASAGAQCQVEFDQTYDVPPHCVFSPMNENAATASMNVFIPQPNGGNFQIRFVNPDVAPTSYEWSVRCE